MLGWAADQSLTANSFRSFPSRHHAKDLGDGQLDPEAVPEIAEDGRGGQAFHGTEFPSGVEPVAISSPARALGARGGSHTVAIRSPIRAKPENVGAPRAARLARRTIKIRPRAIRAALASVRRGRARGPPPASSVITFFVVPVSPTRPDRRLRVKTRKASELIACWSSSAGASFSLAATRRGRQAVPASLRTRVWREDRDRAPLDGAFN